MTSQVDNSERVLYLLDRYGVSDEFYHELAQVRLYTIVYVHEFTYKHTHLDNTRTPSTPSCQESQTGIPISRSADEDSSQNCKY